MICPMTLNNYNILERANIQVLQVRNLQCELDNRTILQDVEQRLRQGVQHLIVDLSLLTVFNSSALNFLFLAKKRADKLGGNLVITNPTRQFTTVLNVTKLTTFFHQVPTLEDAMMHSHTQAAA
jgi:anti-anti-sigma factor